MSSRRTLILIAAVVAGAIAAFALFTYIGGIEDRANDNAERVKIFKIVKDIPKGTFGDVAFDEGFIEEDEIPREFRPATAIERREDIDGRVAISNLPANSVVVTDQFVSQAESLTTFASRLEENEVAITISVDQVHGVANLLVPGDVVNIMMIAPSGGEPPAGGEEVFFEETARYLYQKVQILAIGQTARLEPGQTAQTNPDGSVVAPGGGLITFAVPPEAAQLIASAADRGLYITLVPKDYQPKPLQPLDPSFRLPGEVADQLTPYGPEGPED